MKIPLLMSVSRPIRPPRPIRPTRGSMHVAFLAVVALPSLLLALAAAGCSKGDAAKGPTARDAPAATVLVGQARRRSLPIEVSNFGAVEALNSVAIRSQVTGQLVKIHFREGQEAKAGDVLFEIDARGYEAALKSARVALDKQRAAKQEAQATLARDQVQLENAMKTLARDRALLAKGILDKEDFDNAQMAANVLRATIDADRAAIASAEQSIHSAQVDIDNAQINLSYCTLTAPFGGRLGSLAQHEGDMIKANDAIGIVTLNQIRPIDVSFTLPERYLGTIQARMRQGTIPVSVALPDIANVATTGTLTFVDNSVDQPSGSIHLKAEFPNAQERLWPGQYVDNVTVRLGEVPDAVVVSSRAILVGQDGNYCYVVKPDKTVESRSITTGDTVGDLVAVTKGLAPGEQVVLDGQLRLTEGARVTIKQEPSSATIKHGPPAKNGR
jgi:multidrug efflux system membrane fusion protein